MWGDLTSLFNLYKLKLPPVIKTDELRLVPCGLIDHVEIMGPFKIRQYDILLNQLKALGYLPGQNLYLFSYDWRLSNFDTADRLKKFIEQHISMPGQQVDIIAHSMGGIVSRIYVEQLGGAAHVNNLIMMGTPHLGSSSVFRIIDRGWGDWKNLSAGGLGTIRETILSFPSIYQLLPNYEHCCIWGRKGTTAQGAQISPFGADTWTRFDWLPAEYASADRKTALLQMLSEAARLADLMKGEHSVNVRYINVVGGLIPTVGKTVFDAETGKILFEATYPGDGTVIEWSAGNGLLQEARPSTAEHTTIFESAAVIQTIRWVLGSDSEPTKGVSPGFKAVFRDSNNDLVQLAALEFKVEPNVLQPGERASVSFEFFGDENLLVADLSQVTIVVDAEQGGGMLALQAAEGKKIGDMYSRKITGGFEAPTDVGPHEVRFQVPGVETFNEYFFVLNPGGK